MSDQRTIYCGQRHRIADGVPIGHPCRVLAPAFLEAEREDALDEAVHVLDAMRVILHPGVPDDGGGAGPVPASGPRPS